MQVLLGRPPNFDAIDDERGDATGIPVEPQRHAAVAQHAVFGGEAARFARQCRGGRHGDVGKARHGDRRRPEGTIVGKIGKHDILPLNAMRLRAGRHEILEAEAALRIGRPGERRQIG